jgi:hypothetical protein
MARTGTATTVTVKKASVSRQKKVLAALSPTASSPEVMLPVVALDELEAAMHPVEQDEAVEKRKDKDKHKAKKPKLVRDSFTMPEDEYAALGEMKKACLRAGVAVKKSELLRAAVSMLRRMDMAELQRELDSLTPVKAGRPKK